MKLYLSSFRLGDKPEVLVGLFGADKKLAVIANALDEISEPELRKLKTEAEITALAELGLQGEELDLRDYFDDPESLAEKISTYGGVWEVILADTLSGQQPRQY